MGYCTKANTRSISLAIEVTKRWKLILRLEHLVVQINVDQHNLLDVGTVGVNRSGREFY